MTRRQFAATFVFLVAAARCVPVKFLSPRVVVPPRPSELGDLMVRAERARDAIRQHMLIQREGAPS